MTKKTNTPRPVFPLKIEHDSLSDGITLRDWFAGQYLAGFVANPEYEELPERVAAAAYRHADAMIAAR